MWNFSAGMRFGDTLLFCLVLIFFNCFQLDKAFATQPHTIDGVEVVLTHKTHELDLYVGLLSPNTTEESLRNFFSKYGNVRDCRIIRDTKGGIGGFVTFSS